jgi:hypothetical protein
MGVEGAAVRPDCLVSAEFTTRSQPKRHKSMTGGHRSQRTIKFVWTRVLAAAYENESLKRQIKAQKTQLKDLEMGMKKKKRREEGGTQGR